MTDYTPIICPTCEGEGTIWNNADPTSGQGFDCEDCGGTGEADEPIEDDGEPGYSPGDMARMHERAARYGWGAL